MGNHHKRGNPHHLNLDKGYSFNRSAHMAYPEGEDQEWDESQNWNEDDGDEPDKYVGLFGGIEEQEDPGSPEHDYEWFDGVDETETVALNARIDFPDDGDDRQIGDADSVATCRTCRLWQNQGERQGFQRQPEGQARPQPADP